MNSMRSFFRRLCRSRIPRLAVLALVALAWSSPAFCGEVHDAARNGDLGQVEALLKGSLDLVFSKDNSGWTPLDWAAAFDHKDVAQLLLANKADVNARNNNGATPLGWAVHEGYKDVADFLRQHGGHE